MSILQLKNVSKRFGHNIALNNVSFEVEPGTVFALLGENGAGKTTSIRIMLGLVDPDRGESHVLGLDSVRDDLAIRRKIGYVPEQPVLYDWMTVAEIGRFAAAFYPSGFWNEYCRQVEMYKLPFGTKIRALSKGMKAQVSLSLALANDPELLILDEPTSGLDPLVRRDFLESMVERAATGKSVFLSSHQMNEVERVADTVAIMKKSELRVVESLEHLKQTTQVITATLKNEDSPFVAPFGEIVSEKRSGRDVQSLGRNLSKDAAAIIASQEAVVRHEIKTPSLEEIFVAYMQ
ncbi:MAG: ABC transporter ATP-binding protein [Thermoguttaceae bacterium]